VDDDALLDEAIAVAARAASMPRELAQRAKQTLAAMPTVATHEAAVDLEIGAQLWSTQQPFFAERLAQFQAKISRTRP
jgi:enoyl-CoA hydratase